MSNFQAVFSLNNKIVKNPGHVTEVTREHETCARDNHPVYLLCECSKSKGDSYITFETL